MSDPIDTEEVIARSLEGVWLIPRGAFSDYDLFSLRNAKPGQFLVLGGDLSSLRFIPTRLMEKPYVIPSEKEPTP